MAKLFGFVALLVAFAPLSGCNGQMPVISPIAVGDLTKAICTELEANPATDLPFVQLACSYIDASGNKQTALVLVPKADAPAFLAAHAAKK